MRLDEHIFESEKLKSRTYAKTLIERGLVTVNGAVCEKPSFSVRDGDVIAVNGGDDFASKGGDKLEKGIVAFDYKVANKTFLDVGASNGGFTDCLLRHGAARVYAIDVGEGQLDEKLAGDERVTVMDRTNARELKREMFSEKTLSIVCDASFISLTLLLPVFIALSSDMLLLIKPQFECGKSALDKNGIVKDDKKIYEAVIRIKTLAENLGLNLSGLKPTSYKPRMNREFIARFGGEEKLTDERIKCIISEKI